MRPFSDVRVLLVGDVMLDRFVSGAVSRISPEAPVPVLHAAHELAMLGGAGNVARNLSALGAKSTFLSVAGDDEVADQLEVLLGQADGCTPFLLRDAARQSSLKTRFVARSHQLLRVDRETVRPLSGELLDRLLTRFRNALQDSDVVVLSDYAKGVLSAGAATKFIALACEAGKPVVVDPKETDLSVYRGATILKPNLRELGLASRMSVDGELAVEAAARAAMQTAEASAVLVTRGAAGMMLVTSDRVATLPSQAREVYDVSGAGDTVAAALAAAIGAGATLEDAARLANVAAGIVVGKVGTATVSHAELVHELNHSGEGAPKFVERAMARQRAESWRALGLRVGFTNGCFDLLHPGHVALLREARRKCDRLIVGLNTDASVRGLKGPSRPVQSEEARGQVLAALSDVNLVTLFDEPTPEQLIRELRPDVLVKGADYKSEGVVGADLVRGWGGELVLVELVPGQSTTRIIGGSKS